jgi:DNA-binding MarR family transcriptional regulator
MKVRPLPRADLFCPDAEARAVGGSDEATQGGSEARVAAACKIYKARLDRARFFRLSLFGEGAWDTLLAIYVFAAAGRTLGATDLCVLSDSSVSSGIRTQQRLVDVGLLRRARHATDRRKLVIQLTEEGARRLEAYLDYLLHQELAPSAAARSIDPQWIVDSWDAHRRTGAPFLPLPPPSSRELGSPESG